MSLFRKPKKIQRRIFTADDDDDEGDPEPPPAPVISKAQKENNAVKATTLLSFGDDVEEDGEEVFKVKKSTQSKRLSKRRDKEKRKVTDSDNYKYDNIEEEETNNGVEEAKPKKKVTLEGLILSGREALAADGRGDVEEDVEDVGEPEPDARGYHQYRAESVRAALAPGVIPDAALIHAARKSRQQARELGDFVPVESGPRLSRDDGSGDDDDDEGRIQVRGLELPSDKPERGTALAGEDADSAGEEWEEQQLLKARKAAPDAQVAIELNPFAVAPAPPSIARGLRPLASDTEPPRDAAGLVLRLRERLQELTTEREQAQLKQQQCRDRLLAAARVRDSRAARRAALDAAYRRAQAMRGYITDLVECLDEKMGTLEDLEARALAMHRQRCEVLMERRRTDVADQASDVMQAASGRPGPRAPDSEEKVRRCAEREGRRRARRLARGAGQATHRDGDSSDDELPGPARLQAARQAAEIRAEAARLFSDALGAWRSVRGVARRVARWRSRAPALYADAHCPAALPRLLAPHVRHQLILWNPLADEDNEDYERMDWYKTLMMFGVTSMKDSDDSSSSDESVSPEVSEASVRDDTDAMLVPTLVAKVVLPKLTELVEHAWDPMCVRAGVRLRGLMARAAGVPGARTALRALAAAARARLAAALAHDVFLPALPPHVMDGPGGQFWRRCVGAGVRLLRAALALTAPPPELKADAIVLQLIETLSCAAGAAPGPHMAAAATALAETLPRSGGLRARALARLAKLAELAISRLQRDNPLHLKPLEQARAIINEAKAAEALT